MIKLSIIFKSIYVIVDKAALLVSGYTVLEVIAIATLDVDKIDIFDGSLKSIVLWLTATWYVYKFITALIGWKERRENNKKKREILELDIQYRKMRNNRKDMKGEIQELLKHSDNGSSISDRPHKI